jgi:hypothetical protein
MPDFLIVGTQKAATTSLHYYLGQHPDLIGSRPKEVCFFDRDENFSKGLEWYKKNFPNTKNLLSDRFKYFDSTPEYMYRSYVPGRIHSINPSTKVIMLLRDPVSRAFSAWNMYKAFVNRKSIPEVIRRPYLEDQPNNLYIEYFLDKFPSFEKAVELDLERYFTNSPIEEPSIVRRGIYADQIKRYIDLFGTQNVMTLGFRDITGENKVEHLNSILQFLGLPNSDWNFLKDESRNVGTGKDRMSSEIQKVLTDFYAPHNERLFELIGYKPNW